MQVIVIPAADPDGIQKGDILLQMMAEQVWKE